MSKINWSRALADYLRDETQSYSSIAKKYGVSRQSVVSRAVEEGWQDLRHKTLLKVDQKLTEIVGEERAIVAARYAQIGKLLQATGLTAIKEEGFTPENFMQALRAVSEGVKIELAAVTLKERDMEIREVSEKGRLIFNTPEMVERCSWPREPEKISYMLMTRDVLTEMAQNTGIIVPHGITRDELIGLLVNAKGNTDAG